VQVKDERSSDSIQEDEKWELRNSDDGLLVTVWDGLVCDIWGNWSAAAEWRMSVLVC